MSETTATTPDVLVEVTDLVVDFPVKSRIPGIRPGLRLRAVDGVSLSIKRGETVALVGESGSGKSTTGRTVLGLRRPTSGTVRFGESDVASMGPRQLRQLGQRVQLVFQNPYSSLDPRMRVRDLVAEPLRIQRLEKQEIAERASRMLSLVGLGDNFADRRPQALSGGERQRVAIARALISEPDFVVCDEAVSALDVSIQAQVLELLRDLQSRLKLTYLFISHDLAVVREIANRVAVMYLGRFVEVAPTAGLTAGALHPYTEALVSAVPVPDPAVESRRSRIVLPGDPPSPMAPPSGCSFHTRCWLRQALGNPERCSAERPRLAEIRPGWSTACHFPEDVARLRPRTVALRSGEVI